MTNFNIDKTTLTDLAKEKPYNIQHGEDTGGTRYFTYTPEWTKYKGIYELPIISSIIDKKALWTVGRGYHTDEATKKRLKNFKGTGKETFHTIIYKAVKTYSIVGDYFAEIIRDDKGAVKNLKTLNPGRVQIHIDQKGFIKKYVYLDRHEKPVQEFDPDEIFHLPYNSDGDNPHGTSSLKRLTTTDGTGIIEKYEEAKEDLQTVFKRYVKPLIISSVDSDDEQEIDRYKRKLDQAIKNGENMIVPKDTVDTIEKISIPQYSTLDPLPWIKKLEEEIIKAEGIPAIILGDGGEQMTEATGKILYLAFQQMVEWNQLFLEEQIKNQLDIEIKLEFPRDILNDMVEDEKKDGDITESKPSDLNPSKTEK